MLELLIAYVERIFPTVERLQVPGRLTRFIVPQKTPSQTWFENVQEVAVRALNVGRFSPTIATVQKHIKACIGSQHPSLLPHFGRALDLPRDKYQGDVGDFSLTRKTT